MLYSPKLQLVRNFLRWHRFRRFTVNHKTALPLRSSDKKNPHAALFRKICFHPVDMGLLSGKANTRSGIDTPLEHLKAIIFKPLAEIVSSLALFFCSDWKVECDYKPPHFEFFSIQGLYSERLGARIAWRKLRTTASMQDWTRISAREYSVFSKRNPVIHFLNSLSIPCSRGGSLFF